MELLVGTYTALTQDPTGVPEGICSVEFDTDTGAFGTARPRAEVVNPSYLLTGGADHLFAVRETMKDEDPALLSFSTGTGGAITPVSHVSIAGELPCHLAYDPTNARLASAQYWTGDVALCRCSDGVLQAPKAIQNTLPLGPKPQRQDGPHAHCVAFTDRGSVLHVVDLGTDSVTTHKLNAQDEVIETLVLSLPAGCGPRHIAINKAETRGFVICELDETLIVLQRDGMGWAMESVHEGFPAPMDGLGAGAAIRLSADEKFVYLSGRRQSAIACFSVADTVRRIGAFSSGGETPRDFILTSDGNWLIAAHQDSNTLTSIKCDPENGVFELSEHRCSLHKPVCVLERS
ncbi:MAG: lactonase family protein [Marinosulfonomonas sp.]